MSHVLPQMTLLSNLHKQQLCKSNLNLITIGCCRRGIGLLERQKGSYKHPEYILGFFFLLDQYIFVYI